MTLLCGDRALAQAQTLLAGASFCTVAADPKAGRGVAPSVLALATAAGHVIIDVAETPELSSIWQAPIAFGAADAKRCHHALLALGHLGPARWACASLCQTLLETAQDPSGRPASPARTDTVSAAAQSFGLPLEDASLGLEALGRHAAQLHALIARQGEALVGLKMGPVSRLEASCVAPVAEMEHRGLPFDQGAWQRLTHADQTALTTLTAWLRAALKAPNLDVHNDAALVGALGRANLAPKSARRADLALLAEPWGPKLVALRTLGKRVQAYGAAFLSHVDADGRVRPSFAQLGASTGRMACHAPNVQAITKEGGRRGCFATQTNKRLVLADYKACELRILAHLCEDPGFMQAFNDGQDVHAEVAARIFGRAGAAEQKARWRQIAKVVSFGLVYGMGPRGLARTLNVAVPEAERLQGQYFAQFPGIATYLTDTEATAARLGYATTLAGRRLWLGHTAAAHPTQSAPTDAEAAARRRVARNMPIQGTSADIIKLALGGLRAQWRNRPDIGIINCVHDEIAVECPAEAAGEVATQLARHMQEAAQSLVTRVPMAVDVHTGQSLDGSV